MRSLAFILLCVSACAQGLEIRGTVLEYGSYAPVSGAEVTVKEFVTVDGFVTPKVIGKVLTNPKGEYSFRPEHEANFYIEARKDGYDDATSRGDQNLTAAAEQPASLTKDQPVANIVPLFLIRPAEMSGKVVDGDGNPRANLTLIVRASHTPLSIRATTDSSGVFRIANVQPGQYLIRITPSELGFQDVIPFSDAEFDKVDEGVESGYWPGGVTDPSRALPLQIDPGARVNVGTLVVRTLKYPRVHLTVEGDCKGAVMAFMFTTGSWVNDQVGFMPRPCLPELLLKFVPPGGGTVHMADLKTRRWGSAQVIPSDRHDSPILRIQDPASIPIRVVPPEGMTLSTIGKVQVAIAPGDRTLPFGSPPASDIDAAGRATVTDVPWVSHRVSVTPARPDLYAKTIRYYGSPLNGPVFESVPGGALELELDDHAPMISGKVTADRPSAFVFLVRWPMTTEVFPGSGPPFQYMQRVDAGQYSLQLAPGEYRAIALDDTRLRAISSTELRDLFAKGERVVVERGDEKTLDLKLAVR